MGNMYSEAIYRWNVFVGCMYDCSYCKKSFQAQMKRQKPVIDKNGKKRGCQQCYDYFPHFHEERLDNLLPRTNGDQFIWVGGSGDVAFCYPFEMLKILDKIKEYPNRTFFFQTKDPEFFAQWDFPENVILGITLETNHDTFLFSKAPMPLERFIEFLKIKHPRKIITIEPIMKFNLEQMVDWCVEINPERIYIGYDSKKNKLREPSLEKTKEFIKLLKFFLPNCKIKEKLMRKAWDEK